MKNLKKIFALITVICMLASTMTVVFADTTTKYVTGQEKTTSTYTTETGNTGKFIMKYRVIDGTNNVLLTKVEATPNNATTGMDIVIPETIKDGDTTYNVVGTYGNVFTNSDNYSSVVMPDTITAVLGSNLFYNCKKLKSVKLSNNIDTTIAKGEYVIGNDTNISYVAGVFSGCTGLKEVTLPKGANFTKIPSNMFRGCQLDKLVIYDNVTYVPNDAFTQNIDSWGDAWVNNIYGNASSNGIVSKVLELVDGEPDVTQKVYATNFDTYDLGNGTCAVTGIKDGTNLYGLKGAVYMPEELNGKKVTAMMHNTENTNGGNIFKDSCDNLKEFYMADSITKILVREEVKDSEGNGTGKYVIKDNYNTHYYNIFYGAKNLEKVHLSDNLTGIIRGIFANNPGNQYSKITEIVIPDGVTEISRCFRTMSGLKRVITSPDSKLTAITNESFDGSPLLEEVYLPGATITGYFYAGTFGNDTNLSKKLAIITTEANANPDSVIGKFAASKDIKVYTNLDANIIADAVVAEDGKSVTATLRSRGLGYNAMEAGTFRYICAVYDTDGTLAQVKVSDAQQNVDFTSSLIGGSATITLDEAVEAGQTVKVYAWTDLENVVPVAQPAKFYNK